MTDGGCRVKTSVFDNVLNAAASVQSESESALQYQYTDTGVKRMADKKDEVVLSIRNMSKSFGRNRVLDHINLD